jgi:heparanase 1
MNFTSYSLVLNRSTFSWVDKLGMASRLGLKRVMRQELCCDGYAVLGDGGRTAFPDYWATVLWKRLMGKRVLAITGDDAPGRTVRTYAHCLARVPARDAANGGIALAVINMQNTSVHVDISTDRSRVKGQTTSAQQQQQQPRREIYRLGTVEGVFTGHRATLNGVELLVGAGGMLPTLTPTIEAAEGPLKLEALSVSFVVLPDADAKGCT